tara:strand:- start:876 stop:1547 length:672 start_codon:yes stop_codon:yes gene_type:complete
MKRVIVISAHPDDEVLGAGGTLLKHKRNKDDIAWIIVTSLFEEQGFSKKDILKRNNEIDIVSKKLGIKTIFKLDYPTMTLSTSTVNELVPKISKIFNEFKPEIIYLMNRSDSHSDHRRVFEASYSCTKSFRFDFIKKVLMYECISETDFSPPLAENMFLPNYFVDISNYIEEKLEIMNLYESEVGAHPFPRSSKNIKSLALYRGSIAGVHYAEAFQLLKMIDK